VKKRKYLGDSKEAVNTELGSGEVKRVGMESMYKDNYFK
jgi:hypothetical protein